MSSSLILTPLGLYAFGGYVPLTSAQVDSTQLHAFASVPLAQDCAQRLIKLANPPQAFFPVVARLRKQGCSSWKASTLAAVAATLLPQPSQAPSYFCAH